jgi:hypothetical protein
VWNFFHFYSLNHFSSTTLFCLNYTSIKFYRSVISISILSQEICVKLKFIRNISHSRYCVCIIMVQVNLLNYFVPDVIFCQILSKFLILRDIAHLDKAFCNHIKRSLFLESIRSKNYVWIGDKKKDFFSANGIVWIDLRDIKINHLICKQISNEAAVSISRFGSSLQWLRPYDLNETEPENLGIRRIYTHIKIHVNF